MARKPKRPRSLKEQLAELKRKNQRLKARGLEIRKLTSVVKRILRQRESRDDVS